MALNPGSIPRWAQAEDSLADVLRLAADGEGLAVGQDRRHVGDARHLAQERQVGELDLLRVDAVAGTVGDHEVRPDALDQAHDVLAPEEADRHHAHDAGGADRHPEDGEAGAPALTGEAVEREAQQEPKPARRSCSHRERG